jgi:hypothetical protein
MHPNLAARGPEPWRRPAILTGFGTSLGTIEEKSLSARYLQKGF